MKRQWTMDEVDLAPHWGRFIGAGILMVLLGAVSIVFAQQSTMATVVAYGAIIMVASLVELATAFWSTSASRVVLHLLGGVLGVVVGVFTMAHPNAGAAALTLLLAAFFLVSGVYRFVAAVAFGFPNSGWAAAGAILTSILGVLIWLQWPAASTWMIGTFIGIDFIVRGWTWLVAALAIRHVTRHAPA